MPECSIDGCPGTVKARGMCKLHYQRQWRIGSPHVSRLCLHGSVEERFWRHVIKGAPDECWPWKGFCDKWGYGHLRVKRNGKLQNPGAHVVAWEIAHGPVPPGKMVLHKCNNPPCVNENHLKLERIGPDCPRMECQGVKKPLCIDLFCGLGGWAEGFLAEGYEVIGYDIERHDYGTGGYPGQLVLQDVLTLDGAQFREAACIVASPPCQKYSYMAMPWDLAKREIRWQQWERDSPFGNFRLNDLFNACFRIQREAGGIPMVVENVAGAQRWVGSANWRFGSYYLWGNVPAIMPYADELKRAGRNFHAYENGLGSSPSFNGASHETRGVREHKRGESIKVHGDWFGNYAEQKAAGTISPGRLYGKNSESRKAASAQIAKIPFPLANHIARVFKPCPSSSDSRVGAISG